jgi:hypothetical protein
MHRFKSANLAIFQFCQNGTFEPVHEIQIFFFAKNILVKYYENGNKKNIHNLSQGPPNQGFIQEKAQKWDFLKRTREN